LEPGDYAVRVSACAKNVQMIDKWIQIRWTGRWNNHEDRFFADCIAIR
jgi:hypothetical protein